VDDFTLGVLFVAERDDRGFAPTRVRTEFRVDVSLDNLGDGLGLFFLLKRGEKRFLVSKYFREEGGNGGGTRPKKIKKSTTKKIAQAKKGKRTTVIERTTILPLPARLLLLANSER
jgi:hypothetical protein